MKKRLLVLSILVLLVVALTGCGSYISSYTYTDSYGNTVNEITINISGQDKELLDSSATNDASSTKHTIHNFGSIIAQDWVEGDAWSITDYVRVLGQISELQIEYLYTDYNSSDDIHTIKFRQYLDSGLVASNSLFTCGSSDDPNYKLERKDSFYTIRYDVTYSSMFDQAYETYEGIKNGSVTNLSSFMNILVNGRTYNWEPSSITIPDIEDRIVDEGWTEWMEKTPNGSGGFTYHLTKEVMPSIYNAFPILQDNSVLDPMDLVFKTLFASSYKFYVPEGATKEAVLGLYYYGYEETYSSGTKLITYTFYRANSIGWLITAIGVGLATIGVVLLICKHKRKKFINSFLENVDDSPVQNFGSTKDYISYESYDRLGSGHDKQDFLDSNKK